MKENKTSINWYPGHMEKTRKLILQEYRNIDLVYELVDARIPRSSKISNLYEIIGTKPKIVILTKKDLADPITLEKWLVYYRNLGSKAIAIDVNNEEDIKSLINLTHELMKELQEKREVKGLKRKVVRVLVLGIPNVGKSSLINRLAGKKVAKTGNKPGITFHLSWYKTKHDIIMLDTPGILYPKLDSEEVARNLAAFSAVKYEVIDDLSEVAFHILKKLNRYYPEKLRERYGIEPTNMELDFEECYKIIGKKFGAMRNFEPDYDKINNRIINDIKNEYIKGIVFDNEV